MIFKEEIMSDKDEISKVIQTYIDGMNFSSAEKTKEAFHSNASVVGYLHGDFLEMTLADFSGFVLSQQPSPHESSNDVTYELIDIAIEGQGICSSSKVTRGALPLSRMLKSRICISPFKCWLQGTRIRFLFPKCGTITSGLR